jgi:penicillin amidase
MLLPVLKFGRKLFILVIYLFAISLIWRGFVHFKTPQYEGNKFSNSPYLNSKVIVSRDKYGIPHIKAQDDQSLFFALGYTVAQDRIFQMDMIRRLSQGELSEILGGVTVKTDRFFKTLGIKEDSLKYINPKSPIEPEAFVLLDAYLEGVNQYISDGNLPIEFSILSYQPKKFTRQDAICILTYMSYSFQDGLKSDLLYSHLESSLPESRSVGELLPHYDLEPNPVTILEGISNGTAELQKQLPNRKFRKKSTLIDLYKDIDSLFMIPSLTASNSWILSKEKSGQNGAVLANDPHIGHGQPGSWYEAQIESPNWDQYGYFLPGVPFPLIGHNKHKAWGLTMLENDDLNLYYETIPVGEPNKVLFKNEWKTIEERHESISVRFSNSIDFNVRTTNHGPIINDTIDYHNEKPISMYWVHFHEYNPLLEIVYKINKADSIKEMIPFLKYLKAPGLNLSVVDSGNNIAYFGLGTYLKFKSPKNTRRILNGSTGEDDPIGALPFNELPQVINPKKGYLATANNMPTRKQYSGIGYLPGYYRVHDRAKRIEEVITSKNIFDLEDIEKLQNDTVQSESLELRDIYLKNGENACKEVSEFICKSLSDWDGKLDPNSQGGAIFSIYTYFIAEEAFSDELGEEIYPVYGKIYEHWNAFKALVRNSNSAYWDDLRTEPVEDPKEIYHRAMTKTLSFLVKYGGRNSDRWIWGNFNHLEFYHPLGRLPLLNYIFNVGPFPSPGGLEVVNAQRSHFLSDMHDGIWKITSGPSKRRIIVMNDLTKSKTILPTGNSGVLGSPFYSNQVDSYLRGMYRSIYYTQSEIKNNELYQMTISPNLIK